MMIGGLPTVGVSRSDLAQMMVFDCLSARSSSGKQLPKLVFSSNGQGVALANTDSEFRDVMLGANWIHADGQSVVAASRFTKLPLPERVATTDFFHDAAKAAEKAGLSFYFLGANERQNAAAVDQVRKLYPELQIAGRRNGFFRADEEAGICAEIVASGADILWVALGKPLQEQWCVRNKDILTGVGWIKTCGGLYEFLAGEAPRAPIWMQNAGFEWLYRAIRDPSRLAFRYLKTNPLSFYFLLRHTQRSPVMIDHSASNLSMFRR